jgi:hypothetical protein
MRSDGLREAARPLSDAAHAEPLTVAVPRPRWKTMVAVATRASYTFAGLFLFVLALQLLKSGAGGLKPILKTLDVHGPVNLLGFGWLGSYTVMSGSPIAAISLSLFSQGTISDIEAFAMINGSRMGASFIVLFVGFILYLTHRKSADGLFIGAVALLTAFTLWLPVLPIGILVLKAGWFDSIRVGTPPGITSIINVLFDPIVHRIDDHLPAIAMFGVGIAVLMAAFTVFDRALPNLETSGLKVDRVQEWLHKPMTMFSFGLAVTAITMSVSLSVTLLIPLSLKGYVRRDNIIPYVMGANISTWVDTLVASLLLNSPRAFTIVFTEMVVGSCVSVIVLLFFYKPYSRMILAGAHKITRNQRSFAMFLGAILLVPLVLFLV